MKAIKITTFGKPQVLQLVEVQNPTVGGNEVLIEVEAAGIGAVDIFMRKGQYPGLSGADFIPGVEVAGKIIAIGTLVNSKLLGQQVFAMTELGGYAEQVTVSSQRVVPIPAALTAFQAVAIGVNGLVAYFSLNTAQINPADKILVRGAGGGIGSIAAQLALGMGLNVTASTSSSVKREKLKQLGIQNFIEAQITDDNQTQFNVIIDPVAGSHMNSFVNLLHSNGRYVLNGVAAGLPDADFGMEWITRFQHSLSLQCVSLNSFTTEDLRTASGKLFALAAEDKIEPLVDRIFALEEVVEAHIYLESGEAFGKVVLSN